MFLKAKYFFLPVLLLMAGTENLSAQNFLRNPSFEDSIAGLPPVRQYNKLNYKQQLVWGWYQPTGGSTDYYNSDQSWVSAGIPVKTARTGEGRIGMILDVAGNKVTPKEPDPANHYKDNNHYKEFLGAKFIRPLVKDSVYEIRFHFILDKRSNWIPGNIGALVTDTAVLNSWPFSTIDVTPQLICTEQRFLGNKHNWFCLKGIYKAHGGEQYITAGSFGRENPRMIAQIPASDFGNLRVGQFQNQAYYYIDDFSVLDVHDTAAYFKRERITRNTHFNNFVFLMDISTSMVQAGHIDDMKKGIMALVEKLDSTDQVSLVTFENTGKLVFEKYKAFEKEKILGQLNSLVPAGGSNIDDGLRLTAGVMRKTYLPRSNNTIVIATDGAFKIKKERIKEMNALSEEKNISVNIIQFGQEKSKDLKKLAANCKGNYEQTARATEEILYTKIRKQAYVPEYTEGKKGRKIAGKITAVVLGAGIVYFAVVEPIIRK